MLPQMILRSRAANFAGSASKKKKKKEATLTILALQPRVRFLTAHGPTISTPKKSQAGKEQEQ